MAHVINKVLMVGMSASLALIVGSVAGAEVADLFGQVEQALQLAGRR